MQPRPTSISGRAAPDADRIIDRFGRTPVHDPNWAVNLGYTFYLSLSTSIYRGRGMTSSELDELEESLGIELPDSYRRAIGRLARKNPRGMLTQLVCTDTQQLVEMNEHVSGFAPVAGLPDWPDDLFVIGTDGCGNYYAIRHDEEDSPVLFFDHDRDELQQSADSIEDFCRRIESGVRFDEKKLQRGYRPDRTKCESAPAVSPSFRDEPPWMTSWPAFVDAFAHIAERDLTKPATIAELNCAFGSRAVRWTGTVHSIRLGPHPLITIEMPASGESAAFRRLGLIHAHLRWAGRLGAPGLWTQGSATHLRF
jgi:hypothetical protein